MVIYSTLLLLDVYLNARHFLIHILASKMFFRVKYCGYTKFSDITTGLNTASCSRKCL